MAVVESCREGETASGDGFLLLTGPSDVLLIVIDALGHGQPAAAVVKQAAGFVRIASRRPIEWILERLDEGLTSTRGAVAAVVRISPTLNQLTWASVGDIQGSVASGSVRTGLAGMPGILGGRSQRAIPRTIPFAPGDVLCLATDGVRPEFVSELRPFFAPDAIAGRVAAHMRTDDDSLALVAQLSVKGVLE